MAYGTPSDPHGAEALLRVAGDITQRERPSGQ
jgi:hypothetical protein